jgi:hypothetical protein
MSYFSSATPEQLLAVADTRPAVLVLIASPGEPSCHRRVYATGVRPLTAETHPVQVQIRDQNNNKKSMQLHLCTVVRILASDQLVSLRQTK